MKTTSIKIVLPDVRPFDRQGNWFQSFVGSIVEPFVECEPIGRFWFTRYGAVGRGKHILLRFEADDVSAAMTSLEKLCKEHALSIADQSDYDVAADIGRGERSRFLGSDAKHTSAARRGDLVFTFLHASACLMIDCLVGPDSGGYFSLEQETQSGFSKETSLEQFHHLFCNMTCVPTFVAIGIPPGANQPIPLSYEELKGATHEPGWQLGALRKAQF